MSAIARRFRRSRGKGADRGASTIELALLAPMLLIMVWLVVQFALWFQSRSVALAAAQAGARVARDEAAVPGSAWQADAENRTRNYYNSLGSRLVGGLSATAIVGPHASVGVQVRGTVASIIPGLTLTITEVAEGPVECFRPLQAGGTC